MRCLALAQAVQDGGGEATFLMAPGAGKVEDRLLAENIKLFHLGATPNSSEDAQFTIKTAGQRDASWVVLDGYDFDFDYQRTIREAGLCSLVIDDHGHLGRYTANVLLNQNISAGRAMYPCCDAELLLGSEYVLLRRDFRVLRERRRHLPDVAGRLLITMGGSDPHNTTRVAIEALTAVHNDDMEIVVVLGAGNPHGESIRQAAALSERNIRIETNVTYMPRLLAWADLAVSAAGSTCWELAYMGVPMITIVLADNQQPIAEVLNYRGIGRNAGWHDRLSAPELAKMIDALARDRHTRGEMVAAGQSMIDGDGAERVVRRLNSNCLTVQRSA